LMRRKHRTVECLLKPFVSALHRPKLLKCNVGT
jgi:hypothetical protein